MGDQQVEVAVTLDVTGGEVVPVGVLGRHRHGERAELVVGNAVAAGVHVLEVVRGIAGAEGAVGADHVQVAVVVDIRQVGVVGAETVEERDRVVGRRAVVAVRAAGDVGELTTAVVDEQPIGEVDRIATAGRREARLGAGVLRIARLHGTGHVENVEVAVVVEIAEVHVLDVAAIVGFAVERAAARAGTAVVVGQAGTGATGVAAAAGEMKPGQAVEDLEIDRDRRALLAGRRAHDDRLQPGRCRRRRSPHQRSHRHLDRDARVRPVEDGSGIDPAERHAAELALRVSEAGADDHHRLAEQDSFGPKAADAGCGGRQGGQQEQGDEQAGPPPPACALERERQAGRGR